MKTVYLAGPINGQTDDEANGWRRAATEMLAWDGLAWDGGYFIRNPMDRDYRGQEDASVDAIVRGDLADIIASDILLVDFSRSSTGTSMEAWFAHSIGVEVVGFTPQTPSPWARYVSSAIFPTLESALAELIRRVSK